MSVTDFEFVKDVLKLFLKIFCYIFIFGN